MLDLVHRQSSLNFHIIMTEFSILNIKAFAEGKFSDSLCIMHINYLNP